MDEASPFNKFVRKWHSKWMKEGKYLADVDPNRKKFFVNFPYPYINGYLHLGHAYTSLKADMIARLKRKMGYNVLFPQAFHATGQPIVAAAQRVKEGEKKQIEILKKMGIKDIERFKDPKEWIRFFSKKAYEHLNLFGYAIDWRRKFITTEMNPSYDKFVKWQYRKLYEKGYIFKGSHPVVYCPKDGYPIGDHDRAEGEGVMPEEVVMIKFLLLDNPNRYILVMTYRPETLWGVTNIWINPSGKYAIVKVGNEEWVISEDLVPYLKYQKIYAKVLGHLKGEELLGRKVKNLITEEEIIILPASFVDPSIGTGIVMSVPSHAPYDYVALKELYNDPIWGKKVRDIKMKSLIKVSGYGDYPAKDIVEKLGISSQKEKDKLEKATKQIYKDEFHQGILKEVYGEWAGLHVKDVKDRIISLLDQKKVGFRFYILPSKVVCRCLTPAVVKIVDDQWFIKYSDKEWKDKVHRLIDKMTFYPESIRSLFHDTVDWLNDWALTRERGLGTRLPFDDSKLIESLSDSTIYMAYYTIAKYLQNPQEYGINISKIDDSFFDYVFLGKGNVDKLSGHLDIRKEILEEIREEFLYWYNNGFDLRVSGKDLIKNHLTMMLFHHAAIFPEGFYPKSIGVNGYVMVDGEKMSKSKGNFYTMKEAYELFGAEETRFSLAYAGNIGLEDPNFETKLVKEVRERLVWFKKFAEEHYNSGREDIKEIDNWMLIKIKELSEKYIENMENLMTRDAVKYGFFEMINSLRWYLRRTNNNPNKEIINTFIIQMLHELSVITPHYAQEIWYNLGINGEIIDCPFIEIKDVENTNEIKEFEIYLENMLEDISQLLLLMKKKNIKGNKLLIVLPDDWKYLVYDVIKSYDSLKEIMSYAKAHNFLDISPKIFISFVNKNFTRIKKMPYSYLDRDHETMWLKESLGFLEKEVGMKIEIINETSCRSEKAKIALPFKPALIIQ